MNSGRTTKAGVSVNASRPGNVPQKADPAVLKYFGLDIISLFCIGGLVLGLSLIVLALGKARYFGPAGIVFLCVLGIVFCIVSIFGLKKLRKAPDSMIDCLADSFYYSFSQEAFVKLGVDESEVELAEPLGCWGYVFEVPSRLGDSMNNKAKWVLGDDGLFRSSEVGMTAIFFGEHCVYICERVVSLVSSAIKEYTEEYYYNDIVSLETEHVNVPESGEMKGFFDFVTLMLSRPVAIVTFVLGLFGLSGIFGILGARCEQDNNEGHEYCCYDAFTITNAGGQQRRCLVRSAQEAAEAVSAFRTLLRQKKY